MGHSWRHRGSWQWSRTSGVETVSCAKQTSDKNIAKISYNAMQTSKSQSSSLHITCGAHTAASRGTQCWRRRASWTGCCCRSVKARVEIEKVEVKSESENKKVNKASWTGCCCRSVKVKVQIEKAEEEEEK